MFVSVCVALEPFFLGGCAIYFECVYKDFTVCTTSTDTRAQHHVEIASLSIRSYSLGATHCVAIYRLTSHNL